ncbi:MAG TPA: hypothetical protein VMF03_05760 [Steroidobacteraceae bacterium]|nr:hypothetical protein [Steroidobacteraceae bacterium]
MRYARRELERRFLLAAVPRGEISKTVHIVDRYFPGTRLRLRRLDESAGGEPSTIYKLTQKVPAPDGAPGLISSIYLSKEEYALLATLPAAELRKTRHSVPPFGVDVFDLPLIGLLMAEAEFDDVAAMEAFSPPSWSVCEVTRDPRFAGGRLATLTVDGLQALLSQFDLRPATR